MIYFYVHCNKNILLKLVGYQQPTCLCVMMEFVVETISLSSELYSLSKAAFAHVRLPQLWKTVFRFTCAVLWKLHG